MYAVQIQPRIRGGWSWVVQFDGESIYFGTARTRLNAEKTARKYINYDRKLTKGVSK